MSEKKPLIQEELSGQLDSWKTEIDFGLTHRFWGSKDEHAYNQIKKLIEDGWCAEQYYLDTIKVLQAEVRTIPDTSEREAELEGLLIKMQEELDKKQKPGKITEKSIGVIAKEYDVPYSLVHALEKRVIDDIEKPTVTRAEIIGICDTLYNDGDWNDLRIWLKDKFGVEMSAGK